jgi:hypothetical protein
MMVLGITKIKVTMVLKHENIKVERSLVKLGNFKGKLIELWKFELRIPSSRVLALRRTKVWNQILE